MSLEVVSGCYGHNPEELNNYLNSSPQKTGLSPNEVLSYLNTVANNLNDFIKLTSMSKGQVLEYIDLVNKSAGGQFLPAYQKLTRYAKKVTEVVHGFKKPLHSLKREIDFYDKKHAFFDDSLFKGINGINAYINEFELGIDELLENKAIGDKLKSFSEGLSSMLEPLIDAFKVPRGYKKLLELYQSSRSKLTKGQKNEAKRLKALFEEYNSYFGTNDNDIVEAGRYFADSVSEGLRVVNELIGSLSDDDFNSNLNNISRLITESPLGKEVFMQNLFPLLSDLCQGLQTPLKFMDEIGAKADYVCKKFNKESLLAMLNEVRANYPGVNAIKHYYNFLVRLEPLVNAAENLFKVKDGKWEYVVISVNDLAGQEKFKREQDIFFKEIDIVFLLNSLLYGKESELKDLKDYILPLIDKCSLDGKLKPNCQTCVLLTKIDALYSGSEVVDFESLTDLFNKDFSSIISEVNAFDQLFRNGLDGYLNKPLFTKPTSAVVSTARYGVNASIWLPILLLSIKSPDKRVFKFLLSGAGATGKSSLMRSYLLSSSDIKLANYARTNLGSFISFKVSRDDFMSLSDGAKRVYDKEGKCHLVRVRHDADKGLTDLLIINFDERFGDKNYKMTAIPLALDKEKISTKKLNERIDKKLKERLGVDIDALAHFNDFNLFMDMAAALNSTTVEGLDYKFPLDDSILSKNYFINPSAIFSRKAVTEGLVEQEEFEDIHNFDDHFGFRGAENLLKFEKQMGVLFNLTDFARTFSNEIGVNSKVVVNKIKVGSNKKLSSIPNGSLESLFSSFMLDHYLTYDAGLSALINAFSEYMHVDERVIEKKYSKFIKETFAQKGFRIEEAISHIHNFDDHSGLRGAEKILNFEKQINLMENLMEKHLTKLFRPFYSYFNERDSIDRLKKDDESEADESENGKLKEELVKPIRQIDLLMETIKGFLGSKNKELLEGIKEFILDNKEVLGNYFLDQGKLFLENNFKKIVKKFLLEKTAGKTPEAVINGLARNLCVSEEKLRQKLSS